MTALVLACAAAWAHLPHDLVDALAAPEALDDRAPWILVADPSAVDLVLVSVDAGRTWEIVGGPPTVDELIGAAQTADGHSALLGEGRLWWTRDGRSWELQEVPGRFDQVAARGDQLLLAGPDGIAALRPGQAPVAESALPIQALSAGPGGTVALTRDGRVLRHQRGAWVPLGSPAPEALSLVADGDQVYVGTSSGQVWRGVGGAWTACGALPLPEGHREILALAAAGGVLYAAPASQAPYVSLDGGQSWTLRHGLEVLFDVEGGATGLPQAFPVLKASGDRVVLGGWEGLARSSDQGLTWQEPALIPADHTRGLSFSPFFAHDRRLWIGSYMGGVLLSLDAGQRFFSSSLGLVDSNVQDVQVHPERPERLTAVIGHAAWTSADGGRSWARIETPLSFVQALHPFSQGMWAIGQDAKGADGLYWKGWERQDWWSPPQGAGTGQLGQVVRHERVTKCLSDQEQGTLACLSTDNTRWETLLSEGPARMTRAGQLPDGRLLVGHGDRVLASTDEGFTWTEELRLVDDRVHELERTQDGRALLGTRTGRVWERSTAGSWGDLGVQLPAAPEVMAARPDFATFPQVLIGTLDGVFLVDTATRSHRRFASLQWIDDHAAWLCPDCETRPQDGAGFGRVAVLDGQPRRSLPLRGTEVAVRGVLSAGAWLELQLLGSDGGLVASQRLTGPHEEVGELARFQDLPPDWYELVYVGNEGVGLDAVLASTPWEALPVAAAPPAPAPASCQSAPAWLAWLLPPLPFLLPRIRRGTCTLPARGSGPGDLG